MRSCPQCSPSCDEAHRFCPSCGFPVGKVAPNPDDPLIGKTLPGGFLILELIGIGGMGRGGPPGATTPRANGAGQIIPPPPPGAEKTGGPLLTDAPARSRPDPPP